MLGVRWNRNASRCAQDPALAEPRTGAHSSLGLAGGLRAPRGEQTPEPVVVLLRAPVRQVGRVLDQGEHRVTLTVRDFEHQVTTGHEMRTDARDHRADAVEAVRPAAQRARRGCS